jgi:hypothetical protein
MIKRAVVALALLLLSSAAGAEETAAPMLAVDVENRSTPTLCAEEDNVDLRLISADVRSFQVEARHPAYLSATTTDNTAPDFFNCAPPPPPPDKTYAPARRVLGSGAQWEIVGITYQTFWRDPVPVFIGEQRFDDVHLIQIWTRGASPEEVLVVYPPDGYWRARPLAPAGRGGGTTAAPATAYGSSFLIGPVENGDRPYVAIDRLAVDPATATVTLDLHRGGRATVRIADLDERRIVVDASLSESADPLPFAALRAMFVSETNADAAEVAWRDEDGRDRRQPILAFPGARVVTITAGRSTPGRHNISAPDVTFTGFSPEPR